MQRFEFVEGSSSKFWEVGVTGKTLTVTFGKIGTAGQTKLKEFASDAAAKAEHDKLIAEKTKKGYAPAGGSKAKAAPAPAAKAAPAKAGKAAPAAAASSSGQYFELKDGSSSKFWEITLEDKGFQVRFGKIGTDGQTSVKSYKSAGEARTEHDKLVAEKTKKGYKLVRGEAPKSLESVHARNDKLEAAIAASPDDADGYLVYADWLQAQNDPRGELIVLQHGNKDAAAKKLLGENKQHFFGKLADAQDLIKAHPYTKRRKTEWRWGYLESVWLGNNHDRSDLYGDDEKKLEEIDIDDALGWLLDHPSCRFLRELTLGINSFEDNGYDGAAKVLGARKLPTLRKLVIGDFHSEQTELNWSNAGNLEPMYKAMPNLESLTVRSGSMRLGKIDLPKLRELFIITGGFDTKSLASICDAKWPHLETLSIELGNENKFTLKHLQPIFDGKAFPKVKHLGLGNSDISDQICKGLAGSRIAAQLESLDLSRGTMGEAGAAALAAGKFPKLQSLNVSESWITKKGLAMLKPLAKTINAKEQQEDGGDPYNPEEHDRYIAGYE